MPKVYQFTKKDKSGNIKNAGRMEIKNQANNSADLYFYGDIVSTAYNPDDWWSCGDPEDKAPQDVADFLSELDGMTDINIHVNSGGGDVFAGLAIYNILKSNKANKTVYVDGLAASIASVIALAGDTVIIPSTAQLMVHNPWTFMFGGYNAAELLQTADMLDQVKQPILNVYAENLKDGVDIDTIQELMDNETWLTGEEAEQYFNIQVEETETVAACANSEFFSKYKHTPKALIQTKKSKIKPKANNTVVPLKVNNKVNPVIIKNEGRTLSSENEQRIRDAQALLDEVLEQIDGTSNGDENDIGNGSENQEDQQKIEQLKAKLALGSLI